ncbi:TerB family tellurite resistance protein [Kaustia mangrovi]|uniref:TerB family tellurite resistance protein n=1 Tax=Kaustia mangrovi TaxID=2593653 RepID=A0A7S8HB56_9HYPH|nr:TerB family tellurite resistance protein [Kaustia mangrovi]QPC42255.1 TerB family tellurite resistance protein [Kaustia mangrovi]
MLRALKKLFPTDQGSGATDRSLELAMAALLVRASVIDQDPAPEEARRIEALLAERFELSREAVEALMQEAREEEAEAVDLYRFTRVVTENLDQEGRKSLVEMLWDVVLADGRVDPFEENLVWRVAELIGVSTRDRVTLRKAVEQRLATSGDAAARPENGAM